LASLVQSGHSIELLQSASFNAVGCNECKTNLSTAESSMF
jgi:hypothetical protein